jgi:hypothetical protein
MQIYAEFGQYEVDEEQLQEQGRSAKEVKVYACCGSNRPEPNATQDS